MSAVASENGGLPPINDRRAFKRSMTVGSRGVNNLNVALMQSRTFDGQNIDDKLTEQYRYFRAEFMEAAYSSAVTVPLNIVEDKSGQFFKFVQHGGPKYLFDVIQNNLENIHLVRCSLSLLVIVVTLLRRKLPENFSTKEERQRIKEQARHNGRQFHSDYGNMADPIATWVMDSLAKIGDAAAVTVCVSVLVKSFNASIQELALTLLSSLLSVSDEAVPQMLLPANNIFPQSSDTRQETNEPKPLTRTNTMKSEHHHKKLQHLDYRKFDAAHLNISFNHTDYSKKKAVGKKKRNPEKAATNLSLILSLMLMQKNRHLLAAGCADVIIAMLRLKTPEMCKSIAETSTCTISRDDDKNKGTSRGSKHSFNPPSEEEEVAPTIGPLQSQIVEWAGLKLLLKFLFRFEKNKMNSSNNSAANESISSSFRLKEEFNYAHERVFTAVCKLIGNSPEVAEYAIRLPGAEDLLLIAQSHYRDDPNFSNAGTPNVVGNFASSATNHSPFAAPVTANTAVAQTSDMYTSYADCMQALQLAKHLLEQEQLQQRNGSPSATRRELMSGSGKRSQSMKSSPSMRKSTASISPKKRMPRTASESQTMAAGLGSPARRQVDSQPVKLAGSVEYDFKGEYDVQTEKKHLLKLNEEDKRHPGRSSASPLKTMSVVDQKKAAKSPLKYNPNHDQIMRQSLLSMNNTTDRPIHSAPLNSSSGDAFLKQHLLGSSDGRAQTTDDGIGLTQASLDSHSAFVEGEDDPEEEEVDFMERQPNAVKDFFGKLPHEPMLPVRIEPRDVIVPGEDLTRIRGKFQQLAHKASRKITDDVGYLVNGRNTVPQGERLRRIYAPNNSHTAVTSITSLTSIGSLGVSQSISRQRHGELQPLGDEELFGSFNDADGIPLQDRPIKANLSKTSTAGSEYMDDFDPEGSADKPGSGSSMRPSTTGTEDDAGQKEPEILGLRLENVDFDEQNLFEGFKPIFEYPSRPPEDSSKQRELQEDFDSLQIGKKAKIQTEMEPAVDLLLP